LLEFELVAGGADPDSKDSTQKNSCYPNQGIRGVIMNEQVAEKHKKWSRDQQKVRSAVESEDGERKNR